MKDLLQEYKRSLKLTRQERGILESGEISNCADPQEYFEMLKAAEEDLRFAIVWMQNGYNVKSHYRGAEKKNAYRIGSNYIESTKHYASTSAVDPSMMEFYLSDYRAQMPFENIINEDDRTIEDKELDELMDFRESLTDKVAQQLEEARSSLSQREIDILLFTQQGMAQEEMAEMLGISQQAISKRIQSIKKKLLKIGIEREDL